MSDDSSNLDAALRELWREDESRKDILLVAGDPEQMMVGRRLLQGVLPMRTEATNFEAGSGGDQTAASGYEIIEAGSNDQAVALISAFARIRVVLILNFVDGGGAVENVWDKLRDFDAEIANAPEIFVIADDERADELAKSGGVDAVLKTPLTIAILQFGVMEAIAKRSGKFEAEEKIARTEVLGEFCEYYRSLAEIWRKSLGGMEGLGEESAEDVEHMLVDTNSMSEGLKALAISIAQDTLSDDYLRKYIHGLNNKLTSLTEFPTFIKDDGGLSAVSVEALTMLENEAAQMAAHAALISDAYNKRCSWKKVQSSKPTVQLTQKLECPEGTVFCVIDDEEVILKVARKNIEVAGGKAMVIDAKDGAVMGDFFGEGLEADESERPGIDVFLLDHDLGGGKFGHELVSGIRAKYPGALIIAHTGDAVSLNADANNPYRALDVEVVGKRDWRAVSGVVRRKLRS